MVMNQSNGRLLER